MILLLCWLIKGWRHLWFLKLRLCSFLFSVNLRFLNEFTVCIAFSLSKDWMILRLINFMSHCRIIYFLPISPLVIIILRLHHQSFVAPLIIYLAQELKATLMNRLDFLHRQIEINAQYHNLVALNTHNDRKYHESTHHNKYTEEYESWYKKPVI